MAAELDRFDRMLLGVAPASPTRATYRTPSASRIAQLQEPQREPVVTSSRPPRFVDKTTCPMCGVTELGIEFHGTLIKGGDVHQLAAHTAEKRSVQHGQPRCLGAAMRVARDEEGRWRAVKHVVEEAQQP